MNLLYVGLIVLLQVMAWVFLVSSLGRRPTVISSLLAIRDVLIAIVCEILAIMIYFHQEMMR